MHKLVNGERVELTVAEIEELRAQAAKVARPISPESPTKEQLMAELAALTAKIQALE